MVPDGNTNLAVKDMINAMKFLQTIVPSFGGHPSKITLAGQSAGAMMIRTLLAAPSALSLFQSAIIQSDPMVSVAPQISPFILANGVRRTTDSSMFLPSRLCRASTTNSSFATQQTPPAGILYLLTRS